MIFLTQNNSFIIGDVAKLLGYIMNAIYKLTEAVGIPNIGLCIILFTIVVKLLMMPLTIKQMKFSKLSNIMNPELQAIQAKYKGKTDNESLVKMNEEQKAVYEKYGTSPTGGCLQLLIQMPILFALYRVIQNIPAYVPTIKNMFLNIIGDGTTGISSVADYATIMSENFKISAEACANSNSVIDVMNTFSSADWTKLQELFPSMSNLIASNLENIEHINNFFGINLAVAPGLVLAPAILIPILSALTQWLSIKMTEVKSSSSQEDNPAMQSMKTMNMVMPVMSGVICISVPSGLGIYWIATAVCQIVQQFFINKYLDSMDMEEFIKKNVEKANAKRAKKGLPTQSISANANTYAKAVKAANEREEQEKYRKSEENIKKKQEQMKQSTEYYKTDKPGSLAEKANMVNRYNEKKK